MSLLTFITRTDRLYLFGILDFLVQYIDHVLGLFICGLGISLLAVEAGASLEHDKGEYLVVL